LFSAMALGGWIVMPHLLANQARRFIAAGRVPDGAGPAAGPSAVNDVGQLAAAFQTRLIVANALLEGAAFFCLIAYMVEVQPLCLGTPIVLVLVMVSQIPTQNRLETWVSQELETIEQLRIALGKRTTSP
jgi:hypothetical protein